MGLMDHFKQPQSKLDDIVGAAQRIAGNDPRAALQRMADQGMTCNLPDGRVMLIKDLLTMAEGKTAQQFLSQLGL